MRRMEPAYPDLFPISHVVRPGYLPDSQVILDPLRMAVVWKDAPRRVLPTRFSVPRHPVRALAFSSVAASRQELIARLLDRGSSLLLVLDNPRITPSAIGIRSTPKDGRLIPVLPVLPQPLGQKRFRKPKGWKKYDWGAVLGLFPFPGAETEVEERVVELKQAGASFVVAIPLLLTPKDRHRILDGNEGADIEDQLENALFHADVSRGLHTLERRAGIALAEAGMDPYLHSMVPSGYNHNAVRTATRLRLWARRLDQCQEESSWGWRLRRAASALDRIPNDPIVLAEEDNLRIIPGFDPWVESFTRALWNGGDAVNSAWQLWSGQDS